MVDVTSWNRIKHESGQVETKWRLPRKKGKKGTKRDTKVQDRSLKPSRPETNFLRGAQHYLGIEDDKVNWTCLKRSLSNLSVPPAPLLPCNPFHCISPIDITPIQRIPRISVIDLPNTRLRLTLQIQIYSPRLKSGLESFGMKQQSVLMGTVFITGLMSSMRQ